MVSELIEKAKNEMLEDLIIAKEEANHAVHTVEQAYTSSAHTVSDTVPQIKDMGQRKIVEVVNEFHKYLPLIEQCGFTLNSFAIDVGFPPKLIPRFTITQIPDETTQKEMLAQVRSHHLISALLTALFKAATLQPHLHVGSLNLIGLEVHMTTMPAVRLLFGHDPHQAY